MMPLDELPLRRLDFLKADVEGAELDVLIGARDLITTHKPVLYLEADRQDQLNAVLNVLERYGYHLPRIYLHRPPLYNPQNWAGKEGSIFVSNDKEIVSINLVCFHASLDEVPDLSGVQHLTPLLDAMQQAEEAAA